MDLAFIDGELVDGEVDGDPTSRSGEFAQQREKKSISETLEIKRDNQKTIPLVEAQALGIIPTDLLADTSPSENDEDDIEE